MAGMDPLSPIACALGALSPDEQERARRCCPFLAFGLRVLTSLVHPGWCETRGRGGR
jgi:hypothetical protein